MSGFDWAVVAGVVCFFFVMFGVISWVIWSERCRCPLCRERGPDTRARDYLAGSQE